MIGLTCSMNGYAQLKDGILFQAVARDASGNAASNRDIYVKIFVLKAINIRKVFKNLLKLCISTIIFDFKR